MICATRWRFIEVLFYFGLCINTLTAYPCTFYTWIKLPSASVLNGTQANATNTSDCQAKCLLNTTCIGISWNSNNATTGSNVSRCLLNLASENSLKSGINFNSTADFTYYGLIRNFSNCDITDYNCTFDWMGMKDIHGFYATQNNASNLYSCIRSCQTDPQCSGLDWNYDESSCWSYKGLITTGNQTSIYFFSKNCTGGSSPTTKATTWGPNSPTISTTASTSSSISLMSSSSSTSMSTSTNPMASTTPTASTKRPSNCTNYVCPSPKVCKLDSDNGTICACNDDCSSSSGVVCGSNGQYYNNPCFLLLHACKSGTDIEMVKMEGCAAAAMMEDDGYPTAIKPAYIVLCGVGGGCILMVITAIVVLCGYPLRGGEVYSSSTISSAQATKNSRARHEDYGAEESSTGIGGYTTPSDNIGHTPSSDNIDMNEVGEADEAYSKPYYNADEASTNTAHGED